MNLNDTISLVNYRIVLAYVIVALWMVLIFLLSHQDSTVSSGQSGAILQTIQDTFHIQVPEVFIRKNAHFFLYFILGCLVYSAMRLHQWRPRTAAIVSSIVVVLYAISDEIHQLFVPGRSGEMRDVLIDSIAGLIGIGLIYTYWTLRHKNGKDTCGNK